MTAISHWVKLVKEYAYSCGDYQQQVKRERDEALPAAIEEVADLVGITVDQVGDLGWREARDLEINQVYGAAYAAVGFLEGWLPRWRGELPPVLAARFAELGPMAQQERLAAGLRARGYEPGVKKVRIARLCTEGWGETGSTLGGIPYRSWYEDYREVEVNNLDLSAVGPTGASVGYPGHRGNWKLVAIDE